MFQTCTIGLSLLSMHYFNSYYQVFTLLFLFGRQSLSFCTNFISLRNSISAEPIPNTYSNTPHHHLVNGKLNSLLGKSTCKNICLILCNTTTKFNHIYACYFFIRQNRIINHIKAGSSHQQNYFTISKKSLSQYLITICVPFG